MRILSSVLVGLGISLVFQSAYAACGTSALGTHRTIELDPKDHQYFIGDEESLGLKDKEVVLTFDDGPLGGRTSRILSVLRDECVKVTFFAVGTMAKKNTKLIRRILSDGHTLGHHTYAHNRLPNYSIKKASRLIDKGISTIEKIAYGDVSDSPRVPFFRYHYLARNKATDSMVADKGLIVFDTNIDSNDWQPGAGPGRIHNRIMSRLRKARKGIILMHDIHNRTARMLPTLLRSLKDDGYKVVHIVPPHVEPPTTPDVAPPIVLAKLQNEEFDPNDGSIVNLSALEYSVVIDELPEPVGAPAEAHGTEIDLCLLVDRVESGIKEDCEM